MAAGPSLPLPFEGLGHILTSLRNVILKHIVEIIPKATSPIELTVEENEKIKQWLTGEVIGEGIKQLLGLLTNSSYTINGYDDEVWGHVYEIIIHADAKQALELELKLAEAFLGVPIAVKWTGEMNVSEDELADYLVEIMMKSGLRPKALRGFDAVKFVREGRGG